MVSRSRRQARSGALSSSCFEEDRWLSAQLEKRAFRVGPDDAAALRQHALNNAPAFYQARLPIDRVSDLHALCRTGMQVVAVNLSFGRSSDGFPADHRWPVREVRDDEWHRLSEIATRASGFSRFYVDPAIPTRIASSMRRAWLESYRSGVRGDGILVALDGDNTPVGFLAGSCSGPASTIDLMAVDPSSQGEGVGAALVTAFVRNAKAADVDRVLVGTQAANVAAVRLYERLGFRLINATYELHMHAD